MRLLYLFGVLGVLLAATTVQDAKAAEETSSSIGGTPSQLNRKLRKDTAHSLQLLLHERLDVTTHIKGLSLGQQCHSPLQTETDGLTRNAFSYISATINAGLKRTVWSKNDVSNITVLYHYGGPMKVHMISNDGNYTTAILGLPLRRGDKEAKPQVDVPKSTYFTFESLSQDNCTLFTFFCVPGFDDADGQRILNEDMRTIFPEYEGLFSYIDNHGLNNS